MSKMIKETGVDEAQLKEILGQAVAEMITPMCGAETTVLGEVPLPWPQPPEGLAFVSMAEGRPNGAKGIAWIGGTIDALAATAEPFLGERPDGDDEMLRDCVQELANILAGRVQEAFEQVGLQMRLGLPVFISGAQYMHVGSDLSQGIAISVRIEVDDSPEIQVGFAAGERS